MSRVFWRRSLVRVVFVAVAIGAAVGLVRVARMQGAASGGEVQAGCGGQVAQPRQLQGALQGGKGKRTRARKGAQHNPRALLRLWSKHVRPGAPVAGEGEAQ